MYLKICPKCFIFYVFFENDCMFYYTIKAWVLKHTFLCYRNELQGIKAPVNRTEEHFDAGAKYHVVADVPYIRWVHWHGGIFDTKLGYFDIEYELQYNC